MSETKTKPEGVYLRLMPSKVDNECSWKISLPPYMPDGESSADLVNDMRKAAVVRRDEMLAFQKACGASKDVEGAKFFKGEAADALKEYRAACLILPWLMAEAPKDCPVRESYEWPVELAPWCDRIINAVLQ